MKYQSAGRSRDREAQMSAACPQQSAPGPTVRRYAHPIVPCAPQRETEGCQAMQSILCALAGQNQVLCAMKSELDEILALLQEERSCGESRSISHKIQYKD